MEIFPRGTPFTSGKKGGSIDGQTYSIGVPVLAAGDTALLFLIDSGLGNESEYCIVGAYQGKFIQREGYYFQQATAEVKLDSAQYYPQDDIGMEQLIAPSPGKSCKFKKPQAIL